MPDRHFTALCYLIKGTMEDRVSQKNELCCTDILKALMYVMNIIPNKEKAVKSLLKEKLHPAIWRRNFHKQ